MNFDHLAPFYQAMESLFAGGKLQRRRLAFLEEIPAPRRILLAGEGNGRFLPACARRFPEADVVVVDASKRMLEAARRKFASANVEFVHADLLSWEPERNGFDLIVTNFLLDCFPLDELAALIARLGNLARAEACWLVADFQIPDSRLAGLRSRIILALLYRFFQAACGMEADRLESPDQELERAGFSLIGKQTSEWGLLKSEWWMRGPRQAEGKASSGIPHARRRYSGS